MVNKIPILSLLITSSLFLVGCSSDKPSKGLRVAILSEEAVKNQSREINLPMQVKNMDWGSENSYFRQTSNFMLSDKPTEAWRITSSLRKIISSPVIFKDQIF